VVHGRPIAVPADTGPGLAAVFDQGDLVAVGEVAAGALRPRKVIAG
jgi:hypothetical protein